MADLGKEGLWGLNPFLRCQFNITASEKLSPIYTSMLDPSFSALSTSIMNQSFCAATVNSVMPGVGLSVSPGAKHCAWYITENQEIADEEMKGEGER